MELVRRLRMITSRHVSSRNHDSVNSGNTFKIFFLIEKARCLHIKSWYKQSALTSSVVTVTVVCCQRRITPLGIPKEERNKKGVTPGIHLEEGLLRTTPGLAFSGSSCHWLISSALLSRLGANPDNRERTNGVLVLFVRVQLTVLEMTVIIARDEWKQRYYQAKKITPVIDWELQKKQGQLDLVLRRTAGLIQQPEAHTLRQVGHPFAFANRFLKSFKKKTASENIIKITKCRDWAVTLRDPRLLITVWPALRKNR
ncbi:unnamed protein product [Dibothriocephalus latus]|uniref:Uncharacterized protein n=1 Tax=Dibothriocephalus latus TaxID=60516 RepID=A0A3P7PBE1_DIBLA|nr:unnamed protein product [Dibothriocephalus latus]